MACFRKCLNVHSKPPPKKGALFFSILLPHTRRSQCEPGHFCVQGVRFPCPGGRFGSSVRETRSECQGECAAGWYCPEGSVSASQVCEQNAEICEQNAEVCEQNAEIRDGCAFPRRMMYRSSARLVWHRETIVFRSWERHMTCRPPEVSRTKKKMSVRFSGAF